MFQSDLLHLGEDRPGLAEVGDSCLEPFELLLAQGHSDCFAAHLARPLVARATLAGLLPLTLEANRRQAKEVLSKTARSTMNLIHLEFGPSKTSANNGLAP